MWRRKTILGILAGVTALATSGCGQLFAVFAAPRHPKKTVKAEYNLEAGRLVIVPYAGTDTLFTYPEAPLEISRDLVNELLRNLKPHIKEIVHPAEVARWQESNLEWPSMALEDIAKTFQADTLLYVELEQYSMVEEQSANLLRGHVKAHVQVVKAGASHNPVYETTVETIFPEDQPIGVMDVSNRQIRVGTTLLFSKAVACKFYDHETAVQGGKP